MTIPEPHQLLIGSVAFEPNGISVDYCFPPEDIRQNGVLINRTIHIPFGEDYDDEIDAVRDAVKALLLDVMEDLPTLAPMLFTAPDDEDDLDADDDDEDDDDDEEDEDGNDGGHP